MPESEGFTEWLDDCICKCTGYKNKYDGYYFRTAEDEDLEGPYPSAGHAREAMNKYY